jgi:Flp pilus assembly protein TadD
VFARQGAEAGLRRYREVLAAYPGAEWEPWSERELHDTGRDLRRAGKLPEAITVFTVNVDAHPDSWNAWDDLGDAYLRTNDLVNARRCVEQSLQLNPGSSSGQSLLAEIARRETEAAGKTP